MLKDKVQAVLKLGEEPGVRDGDADDGEGKLKLPPR